MHVIQAKNVNDALYKALHLIYCNGAEEHSRNGSVMVVDAPVTTVYERPMERVLFSAMRDANPFFHFIEAMWMLAGRNDVASLTKYNRQIATYSDDGVTFRGAYGYRWREWFGHDQLKWVVEQLVADNTTRRAVIQMWDGTMDPSHITLGTRDAPCNLTATFRIVNNGLDMTVFNRSNDAVWGAYGANAVHFSYLLEYVANSVGLRMGRYFHITNNMHFYHTRPDCERIIPTNSPSYEVRDMYASASIKPYDMFNDARTKSGRQVLEADIFCFAALIANMPTPLAGGAAYLDYVRSKLHSKFFRNVAAPIASAYELHKMGMEKDALECALNNCDAEDWAVACYEWLERRYAARSASSNGYKRVEEEAAIRQHVEDME